MHVWLEAARLRISDRSLAAPINLIRDTSNHTAGGRIAMRLLWGSGSPCVTPPYAEVLAQQSSELTADSQSDTLSITLRKGSLSCCKRLPSGAWGSRQGNGAGTGTAFAPAL